MIIKCEYDGKSWSYDDEDLTVLQGIAVEDFPVVRLSAAWLEARLAVIAEARAAAEAAKAEAEAEAAKAAADPTGAPGSGPPSGSTSEPSPRSSATSPPTSTDSASQNSTT